MKRPHRHRVLALHAVGATPALWDEVADAAPELDVLAPDLLSLSLAVGERLGSLVRALAATLPPDPVVLAGCTIGANLALEVAAMLGGRAKGVLLLNPAPLSPDPWYRERLRAFERLSRDMTLEERHSWAPILLHRGNPRYEAAAEKVRAMTELANGGQSLPLLRLAADFPDGTASLRRVTAPVHAIFGGENLDPFVPHDCRDEWTRALGADSVTTLDGAASWLPLEEPQEIAEILRKFAGQ